MIIDKEYVMANYPRLIDDIRDDEAIIGKAFFRIWQQVKNGVCKNPMQVASQTWQDVFIFEEAKKNGLL